MTEQLRPAPDDPLPLVSQWLAEAFAGPARNPAAMALATCDSSGRPSVRMVLLKQFAAAGFAVFYTNYESRKALELEAKPWAAAAMYWEWLGRQLRFEGPVVRSPPEESDAYFATRPRASQVNAWASRQSRPLADRAELERRAAEHAARPGPLPRPASWGGYRLWVETLELWVEGAGRFHERVRYVRELRRTGTELAGGPWRHEWLQP